MMPNSNLKFIETFRGSEEDVKRKLMVYLPLIRTLKEISPRNFKVLDIGCGRGEFLELISSLEIEGIGVDINKDNIAYCLKKGLKAENVDALKFSKSLPSEYIDVISLIHVVEHLDIKYLIDLLYEIYRILKQEGILIIEMPYIKNIYVGLNDFWIDPSHLRPLPYELLVFLGKEVGFKTYKKYIFNPIHKQKQLDLMNPFHYFNEIGYDISIIFFKDENLIKNKKIIKILKEMQFKSTITFEEGMQLYSYYLNISIESINFQLQQLNNSVNLLIQNSKFLENQVFTLQEKVNNLNHYVHQVDESIRAIYNTKLWKAYKKIHLFKFQFRNNVLRIFGFIIRNMYQNTLVRKLVFSFLERNPKIKNKLKKILLKINSTTSSTLEEMDIEERFFFKKLDRYLKK